MAKAAASIPVTALGQRVFLPTWELVLSLLLHGVVLVAIGMGEFLTRPDAPMFNPEDVVIVSAVALPKQLGRMPDKAMRAPDPVQGTSEAKAPPPPTASDMVLQKKDAEPKKGDTSTRDRSRDREELLAQARREALLDSLRDPNAAIGPYDQPQTSPDGVDWDQALLGGGPGGINDPELARYIQACRAAIMPNWTPLPSTLQAHPEYEVAIKVPVAADGKLGKPTVIKGTGDSSFDNSAIMAVAKTGRLPPPPGRFTESAARGVVFLLGAKDKL